MSDYHKCVECDSIKVHQFQLRSDYGNFDAMNDGVKDLNDDTKPYYVTGYYCEDCDEAVSVK